MKVGSLVVCVFDITRLKTFKTCVADGLPVKRPVVGELYVVRETFVRNKKPSLRYLYLEEIDNRHLIGKYSSLLESTIKREPGFLQNYFVEVQSPLDVLELFEQENTVTA